MKTKVEVLGYEIEIEEVDGVVTVKADLDGETVEEFTLETPEGEEGQGDDDVKGFKDFDGQAQEEDFGDEESEGQDDDEEDEDEEGQEDDEKETLESFQSFINKK
jgi:hypothetical protein